MVTDSADLCDNCSSEYNLSSDQKECLAKVEFCEIMVVGSTDEC